MNNEKKYCGRFLATKKSDNTTKANGAAPIYIDSKSDLQF